MRFGVLPDGYVPHGTAPAGEAHASHLLGHLEPEHARTHWRTAVELFTRMQSPEAGTPRALV